MQAPSLFRLSFSTVSKKLTSSTRIYHVTQDCLFLAFVGIIFVMLYVTKLGFYSDDWSFLAPLSLAEDQSIGSLFRSIYTPWVRMRPVQILYIATLYRLFGSDPLGYHIINAVVQISISILFYLVLRKLDQRRAFALAVPLIYSLLPHYSTNHFWVLASPINLSIALLFLHFYADLKALELRGVAQTWSLKLLSIFSLLGSTLTYEIALPLFLLGPLLLWYRSQQINGTRSSTIYIGRRKVLIFSGSNLLTLLVVAVFKVSTSVRTVHLGIVAQITWFVQLVLGAARISYVDYGIKLPVVIWQVFQDYGDWKIILLSIVLAFAVLVYVYRTTGSRITLFKRYTSLGLILIGLFVFGLGYAIFLTNTNAGNSLTGINNRIAAAAALGIALSWVGGAGWISRYLPGERFSRMVFSVAVALLSTSGFLINNTIAPFWIAAYEQEQNILAHIHQQFPNPSSGSTLILDGICPYIGPGIVFESSWDLAGVLRLLYQDYTIQADVVTPNMEIGETHLSTSLYYDSIVTHYPYNDQLVVYHIGQKRVYPLPDAEAAKNYFQHYNTDLSNGCPEGREGHGVPIFNIDSFARSQKQFEGQTLVTQEIRYQKPEVDSVYLVWGINDWNPLPHKNRPDGTKLKDGVMHTPMKRENGTFIVTVHVPSQTRINAWFLTTEADGIPVEVWEANGDEAYHITVTEGGVFEAKTPAEINQNDAVTSLEDVLLVTQEVHYRMPEAGEVYFLWGINEWSLLPAEIRPAGTVVKDSLMYTPMKREGDRFTLKVLVPSGEMLRYGFQIRRTRDGSEIEWIWDGDYQMSPTGNGQTTITSTVKLGENLVPAEIPVAKVSLWLGLSLVLSIGAVFVFRRRVRRPNFNFPTLLSLYYLYDLLRELVGRDMKLRYKRSILGVAWSLLNPLAQLVVFNFIFSVVLPLNIPNYAAFVFTGLLIWTWFQSALFQSTGAIVDNPDLVRRPGFPVAVLPIVTVTTHLIHFLLALPVLFIFLWMAPISITGTLLLLPLLIAIQFLLALSLAYLVAALHVTFRDTQYLLGILLMLLFYLTPIFYDASFVPETIRPLYNLNPMVHLIEAYRRILIYGELPEARPLLLIGTLAICLLYTGYTLFKRTSYRFVEGL